MSHKVVDQTQSSRTFTLTKYPTARFVEYLDGAGYYASLRGDLAHMLSFSNTASFFQVKSILVRLRREFQNIDFLTAIEIQHAILVSTSTSPATIQNLLVEDGYTLNEVERAIEINLELGLISQNSSNEFSIPTEHIKLARRLLVLDIAANNARSINQAEKTSQKYLLIPGNGANMGIQESYLSQLVSTSCKQTTLTITEFIEDIEWLLDEGVLKRIS